ncbi:MAG: hypothetical protein NT105_24535 [Verrucomicrobia bacterium]|nr:hypothetical protein [Verrucomicrobiota bacterium]
MYQRVEISNSNQPKVGDLLAEFHNGKEVGSLAYVRNSPCSFIRTKALQPHSLLTQLKGGAVAPITPRAFKAAIERNPEREVFEGDVLYARGGNVGEVAFAYQCGTATLSGHMLRLRFATQPLYCFAFLKHDVCKLQQRSDVAGSIAALDNFKLETLLDCRIPFPNQRGADDVIAYVAALTEAIVEKEKAIRARNDEIHGLIEAELTASQTGSFRYEYPMRDEIAGLGRFDAAIYSHEYKSKIARIRNYRRGYRTPSAAGFTITPGPSLEIKLLQTRLDSETPKPGFYQLLIPANISEYGTMDAVTWLGTARKLPLLHAGDILFGEAGFHKGRSIVLIDEPERATTNAHGLYARRSDGDLAQSIFFRCIFNWYRSQRLIDLMAVGGSGGHFSPDYFDFVLIPNFPEPLQQEIAGFYHNPVPPPVREATLANFVAWHREWNEGLGIWELDRELKALQRTLAAVQEQIIEGRTVTVPV